MSITEKKHATFSASSSDRWMCCPGSIELIKRAPPQEDSPYAEEGTKAHSVLELLLAESIAGRGPDSLAWSLRKKFPTAMVDHALAFISDIDARTPEGAIVLSETKVDLSFVAPDMFGTVDCAIVDEFGTLTVIDYKYGAGVPVDPEENSQLIYYALGLAHQFNYNFVDVVIGINQPRAFHERGPIREWRISIEELIAWTDKFKVAVKACQDPLAEYVPGDWCRWCPAKPICPGLKDQSLERARVAFSDDLATIETPPAESVWDFARVLPALDHLEVWIDAVRSHAYGFAVRGHKIPGFKLVDKRAHRKWKDPESARKIAKKVFGLPAFEEPKLLSPAEFEKVITGKAADTFMKEFVTKESSGLVLVSESDKRPAVRPMEAAFEILDGDPFGVETETKKGENKMAKKKTAKKPTKKTTKKTSKK